jgi:hypothetical protein
MSVIVSIQVATVPLLNGFITGGGLATSGDSITLTPYPNKGRYFRDWTLPNGTKSTSNPLTFTAATSGVWTANFENLVSVRVPQTGGGAATGENLQAKKTDTITLAATPSSGWLFQGWYENGNLISTAASYSFTTASDRVITPRFYEASTETTITTETPKLTLLKAATAVTSSWVEMGEIKTSGVRRAVFYISITHSNSVAVRIRFKAKQSSGDTGYLFPNITNNGTNEVITAGDYYEITPNATQNLILEAELSEEVPFLGVEIQAGTVGATADVVTIKYSCKQ